MAKKSKKTELSTYRFMCVKTNNLNYHIDFKSYDNAIQYVNYLNDNKIEWYGLYELEPSSDYLKLVTHKRLIPHDATIYTKTTND